MQHVHRGGRQFRVYGANRETGADTELVIEGYDEADASRTANRKGIFVSRCVPVAADGTFGRAMSDDATVQAVLGRFPQLGYRLTRLNEEDQDHLVNLSANYKGITQEESDHIADLIRANRGLPRR